MPSLKPYACSNSSVSRAFDGLCMASLNLAFKGCLQQFLVCSCLRALVYGIPKLCFKGGLQQFLVVHAFEGLFILVYGIPELCFLRMPAANPYFYGFEVFCKASLNLVCLRMPAAIPYCLCLRGLMQGIPEPCFC